MSRALHPVLGGLGVVLVVGGFVVAARHAAPGCDHLGCFDDDVRVLALGIPAVLVLCWLEVWLAGASMPLGVVLVLVLVAGVAAAAEGLGLPGEAWPVWPVLLGAVTTWLLRLECGSAGSPQRRDPGPTP